ncbi:MAG: c-type cytochrome [Planctomycetota bacterium]
MTNSCLRWTLCVALALMGCDKSTSTETPAAGGGASATVPTFVNSGDIVRGKTQAVGKCRLCHQIDGSGGKMGEPIDARLLKKVELLLTEYPKHIETMKLTKPDLYQASAARFEAIVAATDMEQKLGLWLTAYIPKPDFDRPKGKMNAVSMSPDALADVIAYLLSLRK